ncbi:MAG TPA: hypothetical protein VGG19_19135 [Tepidisphaeraceae bacterium]
MTRLSIQISDDLKATLDARAAEAGCTLEGYVESLVQSEAKMIDYTAPSHLHCQSRQQLEKLALEGLASPTREMVSGDWDQLREQLIKQHTKME